MAETEVLNILLNIANPELFERIESLKSKNFTMNITGNLDKGLQELIAIRGKNIEITANAANAINALKGVEASFKSVQELANIKVRIDPKDVQGTIKSIQDQITRLEASAKNIQIGSNPETVRQLLADPNLGRALSSQSFSGQTNINPADIQRRIDQIIEQDTRKVIRDSLGASLGKTTQEFTSTGGLDSIAFARQQRLANQNETERKEQEELNRLQIDKLRREQREQRIAGLRQQAFIEADPFQTGNQVPLELVRQKITASQDEAFRQQVEIAKRNEVEQKAQQRASSLRQIGLSTALGALQGQGALGITGSFLGATAGAFSGNPENTLIGGQIGGAVGQFAATSFEKVAQALTHAAEAGIQFESSLLGISSILQANTVVSGPGGEALSTQEQLQIQSQEARQIQQSARAKLLPIGIAGEKEATLIQAIIAGASQRGIQLDASQAATVAERLGGAIQAQRPELLQNTSQVRRDVEDLLSGLPNRTVLGSLVKGFAPGIGEATTAEDLIRRTEGLKSFPESLRNSDNPLVALNQFNATLDNLNVAIGDKLITTLAPALKEFTKVISDPELTKAVGTLTQNISNLVAGIIKTAANLAEKTGKVINAAGPETTGAISGAGTGAATGALALAKFGILPALGGAVVGGILGAGQGQLSGLQSQTQQINETNKTLEAQLEERRNKAQIAASPEGRIKALLEGTGVEDFTPDNQVDSIVKLQRTSAARDLIEANFTEKVKKLFANADTQEDTLGALKALPGLKADARGQQLAANIGIGQLLQGLLSEQSQLFDVSNQGGQINQQRATLPITQEATKNAEERLQLAFQRAEDLRASIAPGASEDIRRETNIKADAEVRAATDALIKARIAERDAIQQLTASETQRVKTLRDSQFDSGTFQGRLGLSQSALTDAKQRITNANSTINSLQEDLNLSSNPIDKANIQSRIDQAKLDRNAAEVDKAGASRAIQTQTIDFAEGLSKATEAVKSYALAQEAARDKVQELNDRLSRAGIQREELGLRSQDLSDSILKASRALSDFAEDKGLRKLQAEGATQSAAQSVFDTAIGAGFDSDTALSFLGGNVQSAFIKGSPDFDPQAAGLNAVRQAQERLRVAQRDESRLSEDDQLRFGGLQRDAQRLQLQKQGIFLDERDLDRSERSIRREQELQPFEEKNRQFQTLRQLVGLQQQGIEAPGADKLIQEISKDLKIDLPSLEKAQTSEISLPNNVADIAQTTKEILSALTGKDNKVEKEAKSVSLGIKDQLSTAKSSSLMGEDGTKYTSPDMDYIEKLDPMGALNPSLEVVNPIQSLKKTVANFNEDKAGAAFTGIDVFGGDLLPDRKNKTNKERLEDKVDSILAREGEATKAFAGSIYPDINKPKGLSAKALNNISNVSISAPQSSGGSEAKSPDVVQAIKDLQSNLEASFRKALESQL
jgi:hypothetical protein